MNGALGLSGRTSDIYVGVTMSKILKRFVTMPLIQNTLFQLAWIQECWTIEQLLPSPSTLSGNMESNTSFQVGNKEHLA